MSPEARWARLRQEVGAELERIDRVVADLRDPAAALSAESGAAMRMAVAAYMHAFYTGCEAVLTRILKAMEEAPPSGASWHQRLLVLAVAPRPGRRPPVISVETASALDELLRFRHFFRSSYGIELDVEKLERLAAMVPSTHESFRAEIAGFLAALD